MSSLELSFDSQDSQINFDRARSTTANLLLLLKASRAICNISSDDGEDFFAEELLVYYKWKARYAVEQANEKQERKLKDCFGWLFRHLNTRFLRVFIARLARVYFLKVWLFFVFYFLECFMFIRAT